MIHNPSPKANPPPKEEPLNPHFGLAGAIVAGDDAVEDRGDMVNAVGVDGVTMLTGISVVDDIVAMDAAVLLDDFVTMVAADGLVCIVRGVPDASVNKSP